jgi:hypothetical protein
MVRWRRAVVTAVLRDWPGGRELDVDVDGNLMRALAYVDLVGIPAVGDLVLLNVNAQMMGLGTGGYALVVAIPDRLPADRPAGPGHLVKARYTPLQTTVLGVDEQESEHHEALREADDLDAMPVVVADLHSALAPVLAGLLADAPHVRAAYVMTDGGALPLAFSHAYAELRGVGWLHGSVTVGQAFGGDLEAVTLQTGLLAARHVLDADVAVVTQGPGNLGTGTRWGFSGVASGEAVNAVAALEGRPVAALRISQADPRPRHLGISHHSLTAYGRVALSRADIVLPDLPAPFGDLVRDAAEPLRARHHVVRVNTAGLDTALRRCPVDLSTMGRGLDDDWAYFIGCAAAGRHAARLLP